jgi:phosphatidylglycerophosphate synthase
LILGLRGVVATDGTVFPPSIWGKLKANVQFLAILLAILRYDDPIGPLFLDEWAMLAAAFVTVMSAVEYLTRFGTALLPTRQ